MATLLAFSGCDRPETPQKIDLSERIDEKEVIQQISSGKDQSMVLRFGFDFRGSPQEDARQYLPFLNYLSQTTGYQFKLHFTSPEKNIIDELGNGVVQFASIGASSYLEAHERYDVVPLVRGLNTQNKAEYRSVLVMRPDSGIKSVADLQGERMAFGSKTSTQGHLIPRIILKEYGLQLKDLSAYEYTGSHRKCADAVISGRFNICGMQDTMGQTLAQEGLVSILHSSDYFPSSGIAANQVVPEKIIAQVTQALIDFKPKGKHSDTLYNWNKTEMPNGFTKAKNEDYDLLRYWSIEFGILQTLKQTTAQ